MTRPSVPGDDHQARSDTPSMRLSFDEVAQAEVVYGADLRRFMTGARGPIETTWRAVLEGEQLAQMARLWAALPPARFDAMCHEPRFGLRLLGPTGGQLARIAPCFECHNVAILDHSGASMAYFDADSPVARDLLALLRGLEPVVKGGK